MVIVEGKLLTSKYEGQNGNKKPSTNLLIGKVHFCGPNSKKNEDTSGDFEDEDGVLPFD